MKISIEKMSTENVGKAMCYFNLVLLGSNDNKMVFTGCALSESNGKVYLNFKGEFKDGKSYSYAYITGPLLDACREAALKEYEKSAVKKVSTVMDGDDTPF